MTPNCKSKQRLSSEPLSHSTTSKFQPKGKVMQTKIYDRLSPADAAVILERLPGRIQSASIDRANEIEYPMLEEPLSANEAVIEMAIASFLDTEALGFADCKPGRGE
jgi:hypothetical protein